MLNVDGIYLPDGDEHMVKMLRAKGKDRVVIDGKPTYQYRKIVRATDLCRARNRLGLALDVGAHAGLWSMILERDFGKVVAFEPLPEHAECFRANTRFAHLHEVALGSTGRSLRMTRDPAFSGDSHVSSGGEIEVPCRALDSYGLAPDLIKIDVEGWEAEVVVGAESTIRKHRPVIVVEQKGHDEKLHGFPRNEARLILEKWGYVVDIDIGGDLIMRYGGK